MNSNIQRTVDGVVDGSLSDKEVEDWLRDVFENYDKYKLKAKKQMIVNRETFSHKAMTEKLVSIVDRFVKL